VGGVAGPIFLTYGLKQTPASNASLLLNLEAVFTALMAWIIFRENAGRRLVLGMMFIVGGGAVLTWPHNPGHGPLAGALFIGCACVCWAIDNNLTRKVSAADAFFIAGTKGLAAGAVNLVLAITLGASPPPVTLAASAMVIGLFGYGLSLALFVVALRGLGAARAGAYFSTAPFLGAFIAVAALHEAAPAGFWLAAFLMSAGVVLHLTERHAHRHAHEALDHDHSHSHDEHHRHQHGFAWDGVEPHSHVHHHEALTHEHTHYPDLHHRHEH
jgi:drug/metabolite transporter (DMT)-like permease